MKKILVVGYGVFGRLMTDFLSREFEVFVLDNKDIELSVKFGGKLSNIKILDKKKIDKSFFESIGYTVFSVPVQSLQDAVDDIKEFINSEIVILDVSSVKKYPIDIMKKEFPKNPIIGTHPMFGVPSIEKKLDNLKVVICNVSATEKQLNQLENYINSLGFDVYYMTAEEHDKRMAKIQALTHFIGEGIKFFDLVDDELKTYSYRLLYDLAVDTKLNTKDLFYTIQRYNPYAKDVRKKLINILSEIDRDIEG